MWMFTVGVYLADLSPDDLRLVASYGFSVGLAGVLMGAIIGDTVDRYPRLKGIYYMVVLIISFKGIYYIVALIICFDEYCRCFFDLTSMRSIRSVIHVGL